MERRSREKTSSHKGGILVGLGAAALSVGLATAGLAVARHNNEQAEDLHTAAQALADKRNTCSIKELDPMVALGQPAVTVVVRVSSTPHSKPQMYNQHGLGMNVSFRDNTENLVSGVLIVDTTHRHRSYGKILSGSDANGPDASANTGILGGPAVAQDETTYAVYRQNAINVAVTGPLIADRHFTEAGLVYCGAFAFAPGSEPVKQH